MTDRLNDRQPKSNIAHTFQSGAINYNSFYEDCFGLSVDPGEMLQHVAYFQGEHSAILLTFIKLPFVIKIFVLSVYTGFTVITSTLARSQGKYLYKGRW